MRRRYAACLDCGLISRQQADGPPVPCGRCQRRTATATLYRSILQLKSRSLRFELSRRTR